MPSPCNKLRESSHIHPNTTTINLLPNSNQQRPLLQYQQILHCVHPHPPPPLNSIIIRWAWVSAIHPNPEIRLAKWNAWFRFQCRCRCYWQHNQALPLLCGWLAAEQTQRHHHWVHCIIENLSSPLGTLGQSKYLFPSVSHDWLILWYISPCGTGMCIKHHSKQTNESCSSGHLVATIVPNNQTIKHPTEWVEVRWCQDEMN